MTSVREIMTRPPISSVSPSSTVEDAAMKMKNEKHGCLVVIQGGRPVGMVTERDLVQKVLALGIRGSDAPVSKVMSSPVITIGPEASVEQAAEEMVRGKVRRLVVQDSNGMVGMLTVTDFAKYLQYQHGGPVIHAWSRGRHVMSEIRTLPHKCPNCGSRLHVEFVRRNPAGEVPGQGRNERIEMNWAKSQAGGLPGPITTEEEGRVSVEKFEDLYVCKHCGYRWGEEHDEDLMLPAQVPADPPCVKCGKMISLGKYCPYCGAQQY